ncbi:MAG: secretin and TonB N-terminal domain-containing protein [Thermoanaerobaculia bacterium]
MQRFLQSFFAAALLAVPISGKEPNKALDVTAHQERRYFGEAIDMSLRDADLVETLRTFAEIGGFNLIIDPAVKGTVTVELKGVPWDQALEQILKINGLGMDVSGGLLEVATRSTLAERERLGTPTVVSLALRYADAAVVAEVMRRAGSGILTAEGSARADSANTLVIKETGVRLLHLGRLLARIDVPSAADEDPADLERRCLAAWQELTDG